MKISYEIQYNKNLKHWVVWENIEGERSISCISVYSGTRKECKEKLQQLKNECREV